MLEFFSDFDCLASDKVALKISEKNIGDELALPFYYYDIFSPQGEYVGKISMRIGHNFHSYYNGNIGYEVFPAFRGNGYACEAAKLVLIVAKAHKMTEIYLTCNQTNIASRKTIEKLGATLEEVAPIPRECFFYYEGIEDSCIYRLSL